MGSTLTKRASVWPALIVMSALALHLCVDGADTHVAKPPPIQLSSVHALILRPAVAASSQPVIQPLLVQDLTLGLAGRTNQPQTTPLFLARLKRTYSKTAMESSVKNQQAWEKEQNLREHLLQMQRGMTILQTVHLLGTPSKTSKIIWYPQGPNYPGNFHPATNGTWLIYSTHPDRITAKIGDTHRVLELWFDEQGSLADGAWTLPDRN